MQANLPFDELMYGGAPVSGYGVPWKFGTPPLSPSPLLLQAKLAFDELVYGSALEAGGYGNPMNDSRVPDIIVKAPAGGLQIMSVNCASTPKWLWLARGADPFDTMLALADLTDSKLCLAVHDAIGRIP